MISRRKPLATFAFRDVIAASCGCTVQAGDLFEEDSADPSSYGVRHWKDPPHNVTLLVDGRFALDRRPFAVQWEASMYTRHRRCSTEAFAIRPEDSLVEETSQSGGGSSLEQGFSQMSSLEPCGAVASVEHLRRSSTTPSTGFLTGLITSAQTVHHGCSYRSPHLSSPTICWIRMQ